MDKAGNALEFLGTAKDGMPSGTGGMISHYAGETGSFYFEGSFREGLPDGVVMVEEPGGRPRVREFRAGKDVGNGAAEQLQPLTF